MKNHQLFLLVALCALSSCQQSKRERVVHYLTNGSKKYWTVVRKHPVKWYTGYCFYKNGTWTNYSTYENKRFKIWLPVQHKWKLLNDTILDWNLDKSKIIYINNDILVLNNMEFKQTLVLLRAKDQKTIPVNDTTTPAFPDL